MGEAHRGTDCRLWRRICSSAPTVARLEMAEAAFANDAIRSLIVRFPEIYSEAGIRKNPIVRAEFEHATVIGHAGEALSIGLRKNWGGFRGFRPLWPDDPVDAFYVLYVFKDDNPYNRRVLQRKAMKRRLPKAFRRWVNEAYRHSRRDFLGGSPRRRSRQSVRGSASTLFGSGGQPEARWI